MNILDVNSSIRCSQSRSPDATYNEMPKFLMRQLMRNLQNDREQWRIVKCKEMKRAAAIGNGCNLYRLITNTGFQQPSMSEMIKESDGIRSHSQDCRLAPWREHLRNQFSWPMATMGLPLVPVVEPIQLDTSPPSEMVIREMGFLKGHKAAEPDGIWPSLFKDGGKMLTSELIKTHGTNLGKGGDS